MTLYAVSQILSDRDGMVRFSFWSCDGSSVLGLVSVWGWGRSQSWLCLLH